MAEPFRSSSNDEDKGIYTAFTRGGKQVLQNSTFEPKRQRSFWSVLAKKAKSVLLDDECSTFSTSESEQRHSEDSETMQYVHARPHAESKQQRDEVPLLQKRLVALTSSLSNLGGTIGNAIEEGLNMVETKASDLLSSDSRLRFTKKTTDIPRSGQLEKGDIKARQQDDKITNSSAQPDAVLRPSQVRQLATKLSQQKCAFWEEAESWSDRDKKPCLEGNLYQKPSKHQGSGLLDSAAADKETQLKASRDVAMAMAAKAKLLLRELKEAKAELAMAKDRCARLEEENRIIRESLSNGLKPDEEDLVRIQLETLLAEKARLAQENAYYGRENQFLREMIDYHRLTMQGGGTFPEESVLDVAERACDCIFDEAEDLPEETIITTVLD